jgi:putative transposase
LFGLSTIERWYYKALRSKAGPVEALNGAKSAPTTGSIPRLSLPGIRLLTEQHRQHPSWSYQLHFDNLAVVVEQQPQANPMPSYASVLRYMKATGLFKRPAAGRPQSLARKRRSTASKPGRSAATRANMSTDSGIWIFITAPCACCWTTANGPIRSCWASWMTARVCAAISNGIWPKGLANCATAGPGFSKAGFAPRPLSDNGSAMLAAETVQGLARLGIVHETTLPFSPYQNGKQEVFWGQIEGRLLPMLETVTDLSLRQLNEATLAWVEMEYNHKTHSELGMSPLHCYLQHKDVGRPCPTSEQLQLAFTKEIRRTQRRSDGTITLAGIRFEIPSRYGHFPWVSVRVATWDLSRVHLSDPQSGAILCRLYPLDKNKNAQGQRARQSHAAGGGGYRRLPPGRGAIAPETHQRLRPDRAASGLSASKTKSPNLNPS